MKNLLTCQVQLKLIPSSRRKSVALQDVLQSHGKQICEASQQSKAEQKQKEERGIKLSPNEAAVIPLKDNIKYFLFAILRYFDVGERHLNIPPSGAHFPNPIPTNNELGF